MTENSAIENEGKPKVTANSLPALPLARIHFALLVMLVGFIIFLVGARPAIFGLDRSPVVGFIQIAVMLIGIMIICLGGYTSVRALWRHQPPSISADIGMRLVSTGYVIVTFSGLADVFGVGTHPLPGVPYFGVWQARGMEIGCAIIAIGFILSFPPASKPQ
ncbi:MAG TPA: hypothetical protein PKZ26_06490 [Anaerolineaceae bacterium]|jgi:hypothetical protein|nr:hypothetical protein [Anaerolineaceae bacterium]NMC17170.1 hypothetical protein [Chloroflexota bacterium]HNS07358.1 hypothetical protein [Anaerolineaceae bacterium]HNW13068.1 hypothetical protein [Anaerolineaceae bacterium]HOE01754.1 hypothetical protein [Anaerolineaceae bacterium]